METTEALVMAADNPHFPAWLRTACKEGATEIVRRFGIGGELIIARRERDELMALLRDIDANMRRAWYDKRLSHDAWPASLSERLEKTIYTADCGAPAVG